jgi:phospholipase/lecithinase/hemolysin
LRDFYWYKNLKISQLDVFKLFDEIVAAPSSFSFANVTLSSQGAAVDPDTYLFWDDLHPTTHGHNILSETAGQILAHKQSSYDIDAQQAEQSQHRVGVAH